MPGRWRYARSSHDQVGRAAASRSAILIGEFRHKAKTMQDAIQKTRKELSRLDASDVQIEFDDQFEPETGTLLKVQIGDAYWHLLPGNFFEILQPMPDGVGTEAIKEAIEEEANPVWHGPSPKGSRDTSS